jgi:hypothetical protein
MDDQEMTTWAHTWRPRAAAEDHVKFMADIMSMLSLIHPEDGDVIEAWRFDLYVDATRPAAERKARADEIARAWEATGAWRNGYYIATREMFGGPEFGTLEIQFAPPIMAADLHADAA